MVNPTWVSEHNFPALLSRCMFPKTSDALHELQTNRAKKRNPMPSPPLPDMPGMKPQEVRREIFMQEVKNMANRLVNVKYLTATVLSCHRPCLGIDF